MIDIKVFDSARFNTSKWSGGVTTELMIAPQGASYAERRFDYRISTAVVELEESVFTPLPGVKRFLTPLCGDGFRLTLNGAEEINLLPGSVLEFSGSDAVVCRGSGRDLNLMLKNAEGSMLCVKAGEVFEVPFGFEVFVYAAEELRLSAPRGGAGVLLEAGGFAGIKPSRKGERLRTTGVLVLFSVRRY